MSPILSLVQLHFDPTQTPTAMLNHHHLTLINPVIYPVVGWVGEFGMGNQGDYPIHNRDESQD